VNGVIAMTFNAPPHRALVNTPHEMARDINVPKYKQEI